MDKELFISIHTHTQYKRFNSAFEQKKIDNKEEKELFT